MNHLHNKNKSANVVLHHLFCLYFSRQLIAALVSWYFYGRLFFFYLHIFACLSNITHIRRVFVTSYSVNNTVHWYAKIAKKCLAAPPYKLSRNSGNWTISSLLKKKTLLSEMWEIFETNSPYCYFVMNNIMLKVAIWDKLPIWYMIGMLAKLILEYVNNKFHYW